MSERIATAPDANIDVDAAFDAEKRQAQQDYDAYLEQRPYVDELGNVHDAENDQFMGTPNAETDEEYYSRMVAESEGDVDARFVGKSLKDLAEIVHEARIANDKTLELDARAVFDDRFVATAEKLGWEDVETLEDGTTIDRNEIADRRLGYYESLMEVGEASNEAENEKPEEFSSDTEITEDSSSETAGQDQTENNSEDEDVLKLTKDEIKAKRARMVQSGLKPLDVGNMTDEQIASYALVEKQGEGEENTTKSIDDDVTDGPRPLGPKPMDMTGKEITAWKPDFEIIDTGDDIPTLDETEDLGHDTVDTRGRGRKLLDALRNPGAYLASKQASFKRERAEARSNGTYERSRRRKIVGAVVGTAAIVGAAWLAKEADWSDMPNLWPFGGGEADTSANVPGFDNNNEVPPTDLTASPFDQDGNYTGDRSGYIPGAGESDYRELPSDSGEFVSPAIDVEYGSGYIRELEQLGVKDDATKTYLEMIKDIGGAENIFNGDTTYLIDNNLGGKNYGIGAPGEVTLTQEAMEWLSEHKGMSFDR